ncbi:MAG: YggS family pyridoxal phosphate-dependent enzyme, partial [Sphaerochaetaceae bacterium]
MIVKEGVDTMNVEMNERIAQIRYEIDEAVRKAGRSDGVSLMAVSKNHPYEDVADALGCNMTLFGENRVQEIAGKFTERKEGEFTLRLI